MLKLRSIYTEEGELRQPICGCSDPYCNLPVADWEDDKGDRMIARNCCTIDESLEFDEVGTFINMSWGSIDSWAEKSDPNL